LVTVYALTYAVGSPILAVTFNNFDRRDALTMALGCFIAGNLLAVAATTFPLLLASRMLMALGAGLCTPTAIGVAVAIASPERRGRAVALVTSGITVATVVGVPLGSLVGNQFGWRATFALVAVLGAVALAGLLFGLPRGLPRTTATIGQRLAVARHGAVLYALATTMLWAVGGFTVFTYLSIPLHNFGFGASDISLALLVFGSAAAIGNMLGGTLADRLGPLPTAALGLAGLAVALTLQSVTLKLVAPEHARYVLLTLIFCWGISGWAFYPAQVARIMRIDPQGVDDRGVAQCLGHVSRLCDRGRRRRLRAVGLGAERPRLDRGLQRRRGAGGAFVSRMAGTAKTIRNCRLMGLFSGFRGCGIWSKDHPRARETRALGSRDAR
jgi:predicted MFS family arabinose efflux permease